MVVKLNYQLCKQVFIPMILKLAFKVLKFNFQGK